MHEKKMSGQIKKKIFFSIFLSGQPMHGKKMSESVQQKKISDIFGHFEVCRVAVFLFFATRPTKKNFFLINLPMTILQSILHNFQLWKYQWIILYLFNDSYVKFFWKQTIFCIDLHSRRLNGELSVTFVKKNFFCWVICTFSFWKPLNIGVSMRLN